MQYYAWIQRWSIIKVNKDNDVDNVDIADPTSLQWILRILHMEKFNMG